ncbi:2-iminoacetate synthase ThiH [Thiospirochaeta perfilievii]|uniref:2-iminoacetate synthase ThiH n=1 Tax=Thiospirochaeta perfilievii TaxID=252967 RepID=A0A5C1QH15_9SPIO|nr:2-iminoacetate synthase ThiH [Thiospirochaeta perfilievii]QEN05866.1 2-iminoacetate synthase ThiH [Thiospirochaeta perfilievii]
MDDFNNNLKYWLNYNFEKSLKSFTKDDVLKVLNKGDLEPLDLLTLLSPASDDLLEELAIRAKALTIREFGKTVLVYSPIYLSNHCNNRCVYCGFNKDNSIKRSRLSSYELENECLKLKQEGIRHILLLTGGDRVKSPIKYIKESIKTAKKYFDSISIEMYSMSNREYKELRDLGVHNVTIYQETYNMNLYKKLHLYGEKSDYNFRLEAPKRALSNGIKSINLGVLLGLGDPIIDFFMASIHSLYLFKMYPHADLTMSLPRIKSSSGNFKQEYTIDDRLFTKLIVVFRLFLPKAGISLSTRESSELRDNLLQLGVTKISAGSKTDVGGYTKSKSDKQFEISDNRSIFEIDSRLRDLGYQPIYKDWVTV